MLHLLVDLGDWDGLTCILSVTLSARAVVEFGRRGWSDGQDDTKSHSQSEEDFGTAEIRGCGKRGSRAGREGRPRCRSSAIFSSSNWMYGPNCSKRALFEGCQMETLGRTDCSCLNALHSVKM